MNNNINQSSNQINPNVSMPSLGKIPVPLDSNNMQETPQVQVPQQVKQMVITPGENQGVPTVNTNQTGATTMEQQAQVPMQSMQIPIPVVPTNMEKEPQKEQQVQNSELVNTPVTPGLVANTNQVEATNVGQQPVPVEEKTPVEDKQQENAELKEENTSEVSNNDAPVSAGSTEKTPVGDKSQEKKTISPEPKSKNKKAYLPIVLLIIILLLCLAIYFLNTKHQKEINKLNYECTPVSTSGDTKELDLNSTIVQDLYNKVKTNIREDIANNELNDEMKLYLAYRQMPTNKIYSSNCNYFNDTKMYAYTCRESLEFTPRAFKEEDLMIEVKKLFGEKTVINHDDIQLGNACIGGYQYISDRGEYVEGECSQLTTTTFKVEKELTQATSTESTIVLYEKVKYYGTEGKNPPEKLVSGTYKYTFKLDSNYNYTYISKALEG